MNCFSHTRMTPDFIIEKYYEKGSFLYEILLRHSQSVQQKALEIIDLNPTLDVDVDFVKEASLLHDIGIFKTNAPKIHCYGTFNYIAHGYLGSEILNNEGFPRHALVCERHTGTGLSLKNILEKDLPIPKREMCPVSLEEQIICFADKFFSKTDLDNELPLKKIRHKMLLLGEESLFQFDYWYQQFYHQKPFLL